MTYLVTVAHGRMRYCFLELDSWSAAKRLMRQRSSEIVAWEEKAVKRQRRGAPPKVQIWKLVRTRKPKGVK